MSMKRVAILFVGLLVLAGCRTGGKPDGPDGRKDPLIPVLRAEIARQYAVIGADPGLAAQVAILVKRCPPDGVTADGPYVCPSSCAEVTGGCVHAWTKNDMRSDLVIFMFAGEPKPWCIKHEVWHFVQRRWGDDEAETLSNNMHPMAVHVLGGKLVATRTVIGNARWPALVRGLQFWKPAEGETFGEALFDGQGNLLKVLPVPGAYLVEGGGGI